MRRISCLIAVLFLFPVAALADSLAWDHDGSGNPSGFVIYYEDTATHDQYHYVLADGSARKLLDFEHVLSLIPGHVYAINITAYNIETESDPSNSVSYNMAAFTPPEDVKPVVITIRAPATLTITSP